MFILKNERLDVIKRIDRPKYQVAICIQTSNLGRLDPAFGIL